MIASTATVATDAAVVTVFAVAVAVAATVVAVGSYFDCFECIPCGTCVGRRENEPLYIRGRVFRQISSSLGAVGPIRLDDTVDPTEPLPIAAMAFAEAWQEVLRGVLTKHHAQSQSVVLSYILFFAVFCVELFWSLQVLPTCLHASLPILSGLRSICTVF